jgi:hypothetical protein
MLGAGSTFTVTLPLRATTTLRLATTRITARAEQGTGSE